MDNSVVNRLKELSDNLQPGDLESMLEISELTDMLLQELEKQGKDYSRKKEIRKLVASLPEMPDYPGLVSAVADLIESAAPVLTVKKKKNAGSEPEIEAAKHAEPRGEFPYPELYFDNIINDKKILQKYIEEAADHLDKAQFILIDLEYDSGNSENINTIFRAFHTLKSSSAFLGIKNVEEIAHAAEELLSLMRDNQLIVSTELIDVIFYGIVFIKDLVDIIIAHIDDTAGMVTNFRNINIYRYIQLLDNIKRQYRIRKIGEILLDMGSIDQEMVDSILSAQKTSNKRFGEIAIERGDVSRDTVDAATQLQKKQKLKNSYVKVSADRLNELVDLIGELVVNQSIIREIVSASDQSIDQHLTQLEVISSSIKNNVLAMGMIPIGDTFNHLRVVIRNASKETGKIVDVQVEGGETELDRNIIESIYDPLVHIVRNSVDHGLENMDERKSAGKNDIGVISLTARHRGNGIEIQVSDDGKGIDIERVIGTALEKGLIHEDDAARLRESPRDAYNLLFLPGFSTKKVVTELSGRGVGLDVVKKNLDQIRGKIEIATEIGKGTTFTIKLPLTLAIIDGFVTKVNDERFIFPFHVIDEIVVPVEDQLQKMSDGEYFLLNRGQHIPVIFIENVLQSQEQYAENQIIIVVSLEDSQYGIAVHEVLGKQEIVIKSLNSSLHRFDLFSGGTIFGDGSIGFVVDIEALISQAQKLQTGG